MQLSYLQPARHLQVDIIMNCRALQRVPAGDKHDEDSFDITSSQSIPGRKGLPLVGEVQEIGLSVICNRHPSRVIIQLRSRDFDVGRDGGRTVEESGMGLVGGSGFGFGRIIYCTLTKDLLR